MTTEMRRWIKLFEATYPKRVPSSFIDALVMRLHGRSEDLDEGNLLYRVDRFMNYRLESISISDLDLNEFGVDQTEVHAMKQMTTAMPPIVFDPIARSIIDGTHRANAAAQLGSTYIQAYVGVDLNPHWDENADESDDST